MIKAALHASRSYDADIESGGLRRVGLVGCVKRKGSARTVARDLYVSPLFAGRKRFVETSCTEWWILSAEHGLVDPATQLEPYDVALGAVGAAARRLWAARVLGQMDEWIAPRPGDVFEFHAGAHYRESGLATGLQLRGVTVENPTAGMGIGDQLSFYKRSA